jgi:hypothetical protein
MKGCDFIIIIFIPYGHSIELVEAIFQAVDVWLKLSKSFAFVKFRNIQL